MSAVLLVRCGTDRLALPVSGVEKVITVDDVVPAPVARGSVRGLVPVRDRLAPLAHLRALLDDGEAPAARAAAAVLVRAGGRLVALEVDEVIDLLREAPQPVPDGWRMPWAAGVVPLESELVPVIDLDGLEGRLTDGG